MTKYLANANGDWWEVVEGDSLYLIDTESDGMKAKLEEWGYVEGEWNDKFEQFIIENGRAVRVREGDK